MEARDTEGGREEAREKDESKEEWEKERGEREKKYQCLFYNIHQSSRDHSLGGLTIRHK